MSENPSNSNTPRPVIKDEVASALGKIPSGLFILSLVDAFGKDDFMLASWVQQCSFTPLMVNIAIRSDRDILPLMTPGKPFNLHIIKEGQNQLVGRFLKPLPDSDSLAGLNFNKEQGEPVVFIDTCSVLHCKAVSLLEAGDHKLLVAEVVSGAILAGGDPFTHVRKNARSY